MQIGEIAFYLLSVSVIIVLGETGWGECMFLPVPPISYGGFMDEGW